MSFECSLRQVARSGGMGHASLPTPVDGPRILEALLPGSVSAPS